MKAAFPLLTCIIVCTHLRAQIPNSGFENWTNEGSYLNPIGWWTANDSVNSGNTYPVSRSDDHYPPGVGQCSIQLQNNLALQPSWTAWGITWTGGFAGNDNPAFEISGHPNKMYGYYKFFPQNGDTFEIHIRLYQNGIDVGGGQFKRASEQAQWSIFEISFNNYAYADSARIMILACYANDAPQPLGNSMAFIDNLSFDSLIINSSSEVSSESNVNIGPNPVEALLRVNMSSMREVKEISIYGIDGKLWIRKWPSSLMEDIDVSFLPKGMYWVSLLGANTSYTERFVKQ
jgi:hypothetical protein